VQSFQKNAEPEGTRAFRPLPVGSTSVTAKARQSAKLRELRQALIEDGCAGLCKQAAALGIHRSTAWVVLNGMYKASGLSASVIDRMMSSPKLPSQARRILQEYIREKSGGLYGHDQKRVRVFRDKLSFREDQSAGFQSDNRT
jgi:hypothetical protein